VLGDLVDARIERVERQDLVDDAATDASWAPMLRPVRASPVAIVRRP